MEDDEVCVPEIDSTYTDNERKSHRYSYHELSDTEHRKVLTQAFSLHEVLPYGELIVALKKVCAVVVGQSYGQAKLKEFLQFMLNKGILIKEERGKYRLNQDNQS